MCSTFHSLYNRFWRKENAIGLLSISKIENLYVNLITYQSWCNLNDIKDGAIILSDKFAIDNLKSSIDNFLLYWILCDKEKTVENFWSQFQKKLLLIVHEIICD